MVCFLRCWSELHIDKGFALERSIFALRGEVRRTPDDIECRRGKDRVGALGDFRVENFSPSDQQSRERSRAGSTRYIRQGRIPADRRDASEERRLRKSQEKRQGSRIYSHGMNSETDAKTFAREWIDAWNSHRLDAILSHYHEDAVLTSPVAVKLLGDASGTVRGKAALRGYFTRGLEAYPELRFELVDVMRGLSSIVLCYVNQKGTKTAEFMELDDSGKVTRVVANYSV